MTPFKDQRIPRYGFTSADPTGDIPADALILGSFNLMYRGQDELETVGGFKRTTYGSVPNPGGDVSMIVGKGWAVIGDTLNEGAGSIVEFVGRSLWHTGVGDIIVYNPGITAVPQALANSPSQNNIPQVSVLNNTKTGYTTPFQMGLLKQFTAPILSVATTGVNNKLNGTYSLVMTWFRDATGAESLPSPPSNIVQFSNQTGIVQFPTSTNTVNPRDRWRIYVTPSGFGAIGGYFFLLEVPERRINEETGNGYAVESLSGFNVFRRNPTVTGFFSTEEIGKRLIFRNSGGTILHTATVTGVITNEFTVKGVTYGDKITFTPPYSGSLTNTTDAWSIDSVITNQQRQLNIEWFDNELGVQQPPTDFFPPATTALFIAALGNVMILIGTEDGLGIAVSVPNFPEAFPPDFRMNLSEPPVGVLSRPQDGFLFILGENSVTELRRTGSDVSPVSPRIVADQVGAAGQRAACMAGNDIYLFTKSKMPARILSNGAVDTNFGNRVEAITKLWDEKKVSISFDERKSYIAYMHATTVLLYYPAFDYWATPVDVTKIEQAGKVTGNIISAFTLSGVIHTSFFTTTRNVTVTAASPGSTVTAASSSFTAADVNTSITIPGAGPAAGSYFGQILTVNGGGDTITVTPATSTGVTSVSAVVGGFSLTTFDRDTSNVDLTFKADWAARFAFGDYGVGLMPKTVTKAIAGMRSEAGSKSLKFYRNFKTDAQMGATRSFTSSSGNHINNIIDCNDGEGQFISVELSALAESRAKLYFLQLQGYASGIETNYGL